MTSPGVGVARVLAGSWRPEPPPVNFDEALLEAVEPQIMASGSAGLAWWRIRSHSLADTPVGNRFHDAFRMFTVAASIHQEQTARVFDALRGGGIDAVLLKGWDAARMYPQPGMRPYGDLDLILRPADEHAATEILSGIRDGSDVDHIGHDIELLGSSADAVSDRSGTAVLGRGELTVPREEDRLRLLCLHFVKDGGWRSLALSDVAAAIETRSAAFDWEEALTKDRVARSWVLAALALAGRILAADLSGTPAQGRTVPRWMLHAVIEAWNEPWKERFSVMLDAMPPPTQPIRFVRGLAERHWPSPVRAAVALGVSADRAHPSVVQTRWVTQRLREYLGRLPSR